MLKVGLISDTHGLLRPQAMAALEGCDHLIHAGDIGNPELLDALRQLAPLTVVRGNNDQDDWALELPHSVTLELGGTKLFVVHEPADIPAELAANGVEVVICGHSHKPLIETRNGVLQVNPGSAGRRRFKLPVSIGFLLIDNSLRGAERLRAELLTLDV